MVRIKRRMTYPPAVAVVVAVVLAMIVVTVVSAAPRIGWWPDCNWICNAKDVNTVSMSLDVSGNGTCEPGEEVNATITATIDVKPATERYSAFFVGELYIDGAWDSTVVTCLGDALLSGTNTYNVETIMWPCGSDVQIQNVVISWTTDDSETCANPTCDPPRHTKCGKFGTIPVTYRLDVTTEECCTKVIVNGIEEDLDYSAYFPVGTNVTLAGVNEQCCDFVSWSGDASGSANATITMNEDKLVTVNCLALTSDLTVTSIGCCNVTVGQMGTVPAGGSDTFYDI